MTNRNFSQCEYGPDGECGRKAVRQIKGKGACSSHRRDWLAGRPLDRPVRGYQKHEEGPDGKAVASSIRATPAPSARRKPFEKEYELLASLGLR